MKKSADLRARLAEIDARLLELSDLDDVTAEQDTEIDALVGERADVTAEIPKAEQRERVLADVRSGTRTSQPVDVPNFVPNRDPHEVAASGAIADVRDAAKRLIDAADYLPAERQEAAMRNIAGRTVNRDGDAIARRLVASEHPDYQGAFLKAIAGRQAEWTDGERRAVAEFRNAMSTTDTSGGFGVPVLIDPTVLITDGQGLTGILDYCRIETITNDAWKGVSAAHTAWSFDAEAAEVSDDASTFAQPTVTAHMARGFIPYSIEIGMDYPGFAAEMGRLLADGYMDILAENLMTGAGDGSNAPWGIFTTTTTTVDVTTDNTFGAPDLDAVWKAVPEKFRARSVWVMNVDVENEIRGFGSGTATSRFTVDQTREGISLLNGKPVILSDHAPEWAGTDAAKILAVGDPRNFLVAQRAGMTVRNTGLLLGTTNGRPTGQEGLFAFARVGSDIIVQNAWRVLKNQTT